MAEISKHVDRAIAENKRSQSFTQVDVGADDIILIKKSLGYDARKISISDVVGGNLVLHFNVKRTVYPDRLTEFIQPGFSSNLAQGVEFTGNSVGEIIVAAGETFEMSNDMAITDIHLIDTTTATGFNIFVS